MKDSLAKAMMQLHKAIHDPDPIAAVFVGVLTGEFREIGVDC